MPYDSFFFAIRFKQCPIYTLTGVELLLFRQLFPFVTFVIFVTLLGFNSIQIR